MEIKKKRIYVLTFILAIFLSLTFVSPVISKTEWKVIKFDGAEKQLYDISRLTDNQICISMKNKDLSDLDNGKVKIKYPSSLNIYEGMQKYFKETRVLTSKKKFSIGKNKECFTLDKSVGYYQIGENSIIIELTGSYEIHADQFTKRQCILTGNESYLWTCEVGLDYVDLTPVSPTLDNVFSNETNLTYSYPSTFVMYVGQGDSKTQVVNIPLNVGTLIAGKVSQVLDPYEPYYQLFDNPILIYPSIHFNTTDTNVTQENQFAHLNISDQDLVLYMPFDVNTSGTTYDYTNNSNDGTVQGSASFNSSGGVYGSSYYFDGVDDKILVSQGDVLPNAFNDSSSFSVWIKSEDTSVNGIFEIGTLSTGRIRVYLRGDVDGGSIQTQVGTSFDYTGSGLADGNWHHIVAIVNDTGNRLVYADGISIFNASTSTPTYMIEGNDLDIGESANFYFNGSIDEVMVFNKTLSQTEIVQIYNSTYSRFYPTGEMLFQNLNFGTNNTVNISIPECQQYNGSFFQFKINDGSYSNLDSNCQANGYSIAGNLTDANLTLRFDSNGLGFYSPVLYGNISLDDYFISTDTTPPNLTINSPLNQTYNFTTIIFNITANDTNLETCVYSLDSANNITLQNSTNFWNETNSSMTDGLHQVDFYCNDTFGNINQSSLNFTIDTTPPTINIINPTSTEDEKQNPVEFQFNTSENTTCDYSLDGSEITKISSVNNKTYTFTQSLANGNHVFNVYCNDSFFNYNLTNVSFTVSIISSGSGGDSGGGTTTPIINETNVTQENVTIQMTQEDLQKIILGINIDVIKKAIKDLFSENKEFILLIFLILVAIIVLLIILIKRLKRKNN